MYFIFYHTIGECWSLFGLSGPSLTINIQSGFCGCSSKSFNVTHRPMSTSHTPGARRVQPMYTQRNYPSSSTEWREHSLDGSTNQWLSCHIVSSTQNTPSLTTGHTNHPNNHISLRRRNTPISRRCPRQRVSIQWRRRSSNGSRVLFRFANICL